MDTNAPDLTGKNPRHFKHLDTIKCLVRNKMTPITAKTSCGRIHQTSGKNLPRKIHIIKSKVILVLTRYPEKVPLGGYFPTLTIIFYPIRSCKNTHPQKYRKKIGVFGGFQK